MNATFNRSFALDNPAKLSYDNSGIVAVALTNVRLMIFIETLILN